VAVIGISDLGAIHVDVVQRLTELLEKNGADDLVIVAGGTFVAEDLDDLWRLGVAACYGPGSDTRQITAEVRKLVEDQAGFAKLRAARAVEKSPAGQP
jgi:methylmalonyl-CoA mutase